MSMEYKMNTTDSCKIYLENKILVMSENIVHVPQTETQ